LKRSTRLWTYSGPIDGRALRKHLHRSRHAVEIAVSRVDARMRRKWRLPSTVPCFQSKSQRRGIKGIIRAKAPPGIDALETAITSEPHPQRVEINFQFHRILARIAANPLLIIMNDGMLNIVRDFVRALGEYDSRFVLASRRIFMRKFIAGDAEGAAKELEESINRLYRTYLKHARVHGVTNRFLK
jgi:hypothetical protein